MANTTVPTPQAVAAFRKRCDNYVATINEVEAVDLRLAEALKPIREKFEPEVGPLKKKAAKLKAEIDEFVADHGEAIFAEDKTLKTKVSIIASRTTETVAVDEDVKEADLAITMSKDRGLSKYVTTKHSLNKPSIKTALKNAGDSIKEKLGEAGLTLTQKISVTVKSKGD